MREGKYETSQSSTAGTAVTFLLIGLGAGALLGLMFAPKPGKQMRKDVRRRYNDARENFEDWADDAKDIADEIIERGAEFADEIRDKVGPIARNLRRR